MFLSKQSYYILCFREVDESLPSARVAYPSVSLYGELYVSIVLGGTLAPFVNFLAFMCVVEWIVLKAAAGKEYAISNYCAPKSEVVYNL